MSKCARALRPAILLLFTLSSLHCAKNSSPELLRPKLTPTTQAVVPAGDPPVWFEPFPAHRIIGNVYYVGSKDLATYLITTPSEIGRAHV